MSFFGELATPMRTAGPAKPLPPPGWMTFPFLNAKKNILLNAKGWKKKASCRHKVVIDCGGGNPICNIHLSKGDLAKKELNAVDASWNTL